MVSGLPADATLEDESSPEAPAQCSRQNRCQATVAMTECSSSSTAPACDSLSSDALPGDDSEEATGAQKIPLSEPVDIQRNQNRNQATAAAPEHSSTVPAFDSLFSDASPGDNSEEATGAQKIPLREPVDIQRNQNRDQATAPAPEHSSAAPACNSLSHDASPEDDSELDKRDCQASHSESVDHLPD
ncbi:uncharacterized protein ISCGN_022286 [Ixodes scapularis]